MPDFSRAVFSSDWNVSGRTMVEASAGTGKTYNIQNVYLRLVLAGLSVQQILVVTFTKAATRELRERLRKVLLDCRNALDHLAAPFGLLLGRGVAVPAAVVHAVATGRQAAQHDAQASQAHKTAFDPAFHDGAPSQGGLNMIAMMPGKPRRRVSPGYRFVSFYVTAQKGGNMQP